MTFKSVGQSALAVVANLQTERMKRSVDLLEKIRFREVEAERARAMIRNGADKLVEHAGAEHAADFLENTLATVKE